MPLAVTYIFSPTTTVKSSEVNQNFSDVVNFFNNIFQPGVVYWFDGQIGNIPSAYYYCDGNNGTPNLKKRCIRGVGDGLNLRDTGGAETHVLTTSEMPSHTHVQNPHTHSDAGHAHTTGLAANGDQDGSGSNGAIYGTGLNTGIGYANIQPATVVNQNAGGGDAHSILNPFIALVPIIIK